MSLFRSWLRWLSPPKQRPFRKSPRLSVEVLEDRTLFSGTGILAAGTDVGRPSLVEVYDALTRQEKFQIIPYAPNFLGGTRVAIGDVTGDGVPDVVTSAGPGAGPHVRTFDGVTGQQIPGLSAASTPTPRPSPAASSWRSPTSTAMGTEMSSRGLGLAAALT